MLRRTLLLAAVGAMAGCQGPGSSMNSAFKMPTPSFNLLAPYGSPRVPPPATHSYGQPGLIAPAAASNAPYYPGGTVRGVSHPQSPEAGATPSEAPSAQGNVAAAVWRTAGSAQAEDSAAEDDTTGALVSYQSGAEGEVASGVDAAVIHIPNVSVQPAEEVELRLGGMKAHDLTRAVPGGVPVATTLAAAPTPAYTAIAPVTSSPAGYTSRAPVPAAATATITPSGQLVEITDLPTPKSSPNLQRVRGFDQPAGAGGTGAAGDVFISPQMTISASTTQATRDAVAAAVLETEEPAVQSPPSQPAAGWKSRYAIDES
ncbi:MAG: hypothetical protein KY475_14545 [Planctomycetes bacterium]|nr:hypothetical protein [Planctomycetota bacterium]